MRGGGGISALEVRKSKRQLFNEYQQKGQILVTSGLDCHNWFEEIESITTDDGEKVGRIKTGAFRAICERARQNLEMSRQKAKPTKEPISIDHKKRLWRINTISHADEKNDYFQECYEQEQIWIHDDDDTQQKDFKTGNIQGDYLVISLAKKGRSQKIRAFGIFGDFLKQENGKLYRKVKWLWRDTSPKQNGVLIPEANFVRKTFQQVHKGKDEVLGCLDLMINSTEAIPLKPYIVIIKDIENLRDNEVLDILSRLIGEDNRIGNDDEQEVILGNSQEWFGIPNNLYIIAISSQSSQSLPLLFLDWNMFVKFDWIEIKPRPELLSMDCEGVNLQKLLRALNDRIEAAYGQHCVVEHEVFLNVKSLEDLRNVFAKKIIPFLQIYYFHTHNDIHCWAMIDTILGGNGMIQALRVWGEKIYIVTNPESWGRDTFLKFYEEIEEGERNDNITPKRRKNDNSE